MSGRIQRGYIPKGCSEFLDFLSPNRLSVENHYCHLLLMVTKDYILGDGIVPLPQVKSLYSSVDSKI